MSSMTDKTLISTPHRNVDKREKTVSLDSKISVSEGNTQNVKVINISGEDVTPQPLNYHKRKVIEQFSKSDQESRRESSVTSLEESFASDVTSTSNGFLIDTIPAPFPRNVFGVSLSTKPIDPVEDFINLSKIKAPDDPKWKMTAVDGKMEETSKEEMRVLLVESETISFIEINSIAMSKHQFEDEDVKMKNEKYKQLLQSKDGSDAYIEKSIQTVNEESKCKSTQTPFVKAQDASTNANAWQCCKPCLLIEYSKFDKASDVSTQDDVSLHHDDIKECSFGKMLSFEEISSLDSFSFSLMVMERILQLKSNQSELALYRNLPVLNSAPSSSSPPATPHSEHKPHHSHPSTTKRIEPTINKKSLDEVPATPKLGHLWTFSNDVLKSRAVTCIAWNPRNLDLLAVGYGRVEKIRSVVTETKGRSQMLKMQKISFDEETKEDSEEEVEGVVCCWSVKNLEHPERIYKTKEAVMSLDFCQSQPSFLAVDRFGKWHHPHLQCLTGNHASNIEQLGPVWSVKWNKSEKSGHASVISMSADGKVLMWIVREELECRELLEMRRIRKMISEEKKTQNVSSSSSSPPSQQSSSSPAVCESIVSKFIGGLCMDFNAFNDNIYLIGTEHGDIHKCDRAYTEQYIQTYKGHDGPVYEVSWSPFNRDVFLSCGADWTVRLWVQGLPTAIATMSSSQKATRSICWFPRCSTVFVSISSDVVEIWNVAHDLLEPTLKFSPKGSGLTKALCAINSDCILVGRLDGGVSVFKLTSFNHEECNQEEVLSAVIDNCQTALNKSV